MRTSRLLPLLDRRFGIPLIFLLGLFRKKRSLPHWGTSPRIALLNTAAIGDTILISGIVADLRKKYPDASITFFAGPSNSEAAQLIDGVEVVQIPVTKVFQTIRSIRKSSFDVWIDFGQWPRINALYSYFARASFKVGFETKAQYRHFVYDQTALHQTVHELDNFRSLIQILGIEGTHPPKIQLKEEVPKKEKQVALHLYPGGSQALIKQWPEASWIALIDWLTEKGHSLFLTGGPFDQRGCEKIRMRCKDPERIQIAAGSLSLKETARLLLSSQCLFSVDTGIMHLAAALGCFTIALHGPTSPQRWGGIGSHVKAITPDSLYLPFIDLGFEKGNIKYCSMESISLEQVVSAYENFFPNGLPG